MKCSDIVPNRPGMAGNIGPVPAMSRSEQCPGILQALASSTCIDGNFSYNRSFIALRQQFQRLFPLAKVLCSYL